MQTLFPRLELSLLFILIEYKKLYSILSILFATIIDKLSELQSL